MKDAVNGETRIVHNSTYQERAEGFQRFLGCMQRFPPFSIYVFTPTTETCGKAQSESSPRANGATAPGTQGRGYPEWN